MSGSLKCRKCRNIILTQNTTILDSHNSIIKKLDNSVNSDCGGKILTAWFLEQNELPEWILNAVNEEDWRKGKLKCPFCELRVGTFDFISGSKCSCDKFVLPPVHLIKSKCDVLQK